MDLPHARSGAQLNSAMMIAQDHATHTPAEDQLLHMWCEQHYKLE